MLNMQYERNAVLKSASNSEGSDPGNASSGSGRGDPLPPQ